MPWMDYAFDLERQFNPQANPDVDARAEFDLRAQLSSAARQRLRGMYDLRYGPKARQLLDIFPAGDRQSPIHIYIHGGFWRMGSKSNQSLFAEPFASAGIPSVLPTYDLCPSVTVDELVAEVLEAIEWVYRNAATVGGNRERIYLSGSSVGAQLCALALAHDWTQRGLPPNFICGAALISGIYDIEPALHTSINQLARLTPEMARRNSPLFTPPRTPISILFEVGADEPAGWQAQTIDYEKVCRAAGCPTELFVLQGENHFSIMRSLADPEHPLTKKMIEHMLAAR